MIISVFCVNGLYKVDTNLCDSGLGHERNNLPVFLHIHLVFPLVVLVEQNPLDLHLLQIIVCPFKRSLDGIVNVFIELS